MPLTRRQSSLYCSRGCGEKDRNQKRQMDRDESPRVRGATARTYDLLPSPKSAAVLEDRPSGRLSGSEVILDTAAFRAPAPS
jgi:hypothetical protein